MAETKHQWVRLGWLLLWCGFALLFLTYWRSHWEWILLVLGASLFLIALKGKDRGAIFPGTILTGMGIAIMGRELNLFHYELWRLWPVFFGCIGIGFLFVWAAKGAKDWVLFPGSFFLIACGAGFAPLSWWNYQRWLREAVNLWPILLIIFGIFVAVGYWRSRAEHHSS